MAEIKNFVKKKIKVAPSILSADFSKLGEEVKNVSENGADYIHIDVMDGKFVPNITLGSPVIKSLRKCSSKVFDVHLMVEKPENQIEAFAKAGADIITFHIEAATHAHRIVQQIHSLGCRAGIALNPATPTIMLEEILPKLDMVLIMTVNPGFGGQEFIDSTLSKIDKLSGIINTLGFDCDIEVDGGINANTSKLVIKAGANVLVAGSAVYGAEDINLAIKQIRGE